MGRPADTYRSGSSSLRVLYLAGPGDASQSLKAMAEGRFNLDIGHVGYSDQLFRVCDEAGAELLALCSNPKAESFSVRKIRVEPHVDPTRGRVGIGYHLAHVALALQILKVVRRFRANVVVVSSEPYSFLVAPLRLAGVKVVQALHCVLWPEFRPQPRTWALLQPVLRRSYRSGVSAVLSASHYITNQVEQVAGGTDCPVVEFLPTFRREAFAGVAAPDRTRRPFRVMFVGRFELDKGVRTLLDVARRLKLAGRRNIMIDMCGDGSAFAEIKDLVAREGLEEICVLHGWCTADKLREMSGHSHAFVVPTTTRFVEGFNHAVVEGILVGRPVITSKVCPAAAYVADCVRLVEPDDPQAYLQAMLDLADDEGLYERLRRSCEPAAARFYDPALGFGAAVKELLAAFESGDRPRPRAIARTAP